MTPDWIPNLHPFIVHFPIALLVIAVLFDGARLYFKKQSWLQNTTLALYTTGVAGLIVSFLSGQQAVDTVTITGNAIPVATTHEDWALYTLIFFTVYTLFRFWTWWKELEKGWILPGLILISLVGIGMLWRTGDLGAQLVYKHGVAVGEIDRLEQKIEELQQDLARFREEAAPVINENGSWVWRIGPGADQALYESFTQVNEQSLTTGLGQQDGRHHIEITGEDRTTFLVIEGSLRSIEGRVELNAADFDGEFMLVHHYQNPDNYQFLRLSDSELIHGRVEEGTETIFETGVIDRGNWMTLRVTADGRHFYGYWNQQTVTHPHADEMEPGSTGFALSGPGTLKIRLLEFGSI